MNNLRNANCIKLLTNYCVQLFYSLGIFRAPLIKRLRDVFYLEKETQEILLCDEDFVITHIKELSEMDYLPETLRNDIKFSDVIKRNLLKSSTD